MATLKTGWIKKVINDVSTKVFAISHVKSIYYNYTQDKTLADKLDDIDTEIESAKSKIDNFSVTKQNVTDALGYTPYTPNEVDNKLSNLETNIDWKEAVSTFSQITTTYPNPQDGWTVNVKDTDYTYRYNGTDWVVISANAIPKATNSVDGLLSKEDHVKYEDANTKKHEHSNKTVLDNTTASYTTEEKSKLSGVAANANNYTHPTTSGNKHIPSGGSSGKILRWSSDGTAVWGDETGVKTYTFGSGGDYENIVEGFWHIQQNDIHDSIIRIKKGNYDLMSLITSYFGDSFVSNYSLNPNDDGFHGLCLGNGNIVICEEGTVINGTYTGTNETFALSVSPFHAINDKYELRNCKIICNHLRYCVHDDPYSIYGDSVSVLENCIFVNDNTSAGGCVGCGLSPRTKAIKYVNNCIFEFTDSAEYKIAYYCHTANDTDSSKIIINGCYAPDQTIFVGGTGNPIGKLTMIISNSVIGEAPYKRPWYGGMAYDVEIRSFNNRIVSSDELSGFNTTDGSFINATSGANIILDSYCYTRLELIPGARYKFVNDGGNTHVAFFNNSDFQFGVVCDEDSNDFVYPDNVTHAYISFPIENKSTIKILQYRDNTNLRIGNNLSYPILLEKKILTSTNLDSSVQYNLSRKISDLKNIAIVLFGNDATDWIKVEQIDPLLITQGIPHVSLYHSNAFNVTVALDFTTSGYVNMKLTSLTGFTSVGVIIHGLF